MDGRVNPSAISPDHEPLSEMEFPGNLAAHARAAYTPPGLIVYTYKHAAGAGVRLAVLYCPLMTTAAHDHSDEHMGTRA